MKLKSPPDDNAMVAMKNDIIPTLAKLGLSESRLFQYCLAHYDSRGGENHTFEARVEDLRKFFYIDRSRAYTVVREAMIKLSARPLEISAGNKELFEHWFTGFSYFRGEGRFEFRLNKEAEPYFLALKKFFTRYRLSATKKFKKAASFKLYINLKQWENTGRWEVELDELKYRLGVAGKYSAWDSLKQWIIVPTVNEINEHSDITVKWKPTKTGRRVTGVAFKIREKSKTAVQNAREVHEANQLLKAAEEEKKKRLGTTMGSTSIDVGFKKTRWPLNRFIQRTVKPGLFRAGI